MSDTTGPIRIAAVIPALDEAPSIERVVHGLRTQTTTVLAQVIVVDNGSSDGTADVARAAGATVVTRDPAWLRLRLPGRRAGRRRRRHRPARRRRGG